MARAIPYIDTTVSVSKSIAEIEDMLNVHGCSAILKEVDAGRVKAVTFWMDSTPFKMPVETARLYQHLLGQWQNGPRNRYSTPGQDTINRLHDQAERTAWRHAAAWVKVQLSMVEIGAVQVAQVFMPFMLTDNGETAYERLLSGGLPALMAPGGDGHA